MLFRKKAAIEERHRTEREAEASFVLTREQFLRDGHAVIVGENVRFTDAKRLQQRFLEISLIQNRVSDVGGFFGEPETQHV